MAESLFEGSSMLRIALVQQCATDDKAANVQRGLLALETAVAGGAQLVCFAELAFEPFYPQKPAGANVRQLAEPVPGPSTDAFAAAARRLGVVVVLNLFEQDGDRCYDRHYPEYMRALALGGADLVVVPQAGAVDEWPEGLYEAEMRVAAFQNGYFVALSNRVGKEECLTFAGESFVCSADGRVIARARQGEEEILYADLNLAEASQSHARRLFLRNRRPELYAEWLAKNW